MTDAEKLLDVIVKALEYKAGLVMKENDHLTYYDGFDDGEIYYARFLLGQIKELSE